MKLCGVCRDCKHWTPEALPTTHIGEWGACGAFPQGDFTGTHLATVEATYGDSTADLLTRPDFGCVAHEPKE